MHVPEFRGEQAFQRLLQIEDVRTILDVGSGTGVHAAAFRAQGKRVTTVSLTEGADHVGDFMQWPSPNRDFDAVWACHVLEHQVDPGAFLRECKRRLRFGGVLAVTVPPMKQAIVGGHVTLWNAGLLLYQLILAGFDCRQARVGTYGYNISVIVRNTGVDLPELDCDSGDIVRIADYFPLPVAEGFDGRLPNIGWGDDTLADETSPGPGVDKVPERVAIIGLGPSARQYLELIKRAGGRQVLFDEVWTINALGDVFACDRIFHMDDVRIQEIRAEARPQSNISHMLKWMRCHPGPIYTSRTHPDYPGLVAFPLAEVVNGTRFPYFNSTAAYAVAYAVHLGVKKLTVFGNDFTYPNAHDAEKGRACVEFWLGIAAARGIKLQMPRDTSLMDACHSQEEKLYGYDTLNVQITDTGESLDVSFTERETLPTADEIEHRYDHSRHPSPLMVEEPAAEQEQA